MVKFDDVKSAAVDVEVNVALFKIRRVRLPNLCLRIFKAAAEAVSGGSAKGAAGINICVFPLLVVCINGTSP